jgi:hypothetical protein
MQKNALKDRLIYARQYLLEIHFKISSEFMNVDIYNRKIKTI